MDPISEVQQFVNRIMDAARKGDFTVFINALDDDLEVFDHLPFRFESKQRFIEHLQHVTIGAKSVSFNFHQPSVRVFGSDFAIVNAYDHLVSSPHDGHEARMQPGRTTWVLLRRPAGWRIVSAHFSPMPG